MKFWLVLLILLAGCSNKASIITPTGVYSVKAKNGVLVTLEEPNGTKLTIDDRGQPEQPSIFSQLLGLIVLKKAD